MDSYGNKVQKQTSNIKLTKESTAPYQRIFGLFIGLEKFDLAVVRGVEHFEIFR